MDSSPSPTTSATPSTTTSSPAVDVSAHHSCLRCAKRMSIVKFYQKLLKEKSNPRLKGNKKGIIVKGKEFYIPILNTFPTR